MQLRWNSFLFPLISEFQDRQNFWKYLKIVVIVLALQLEEGLERGLECCILPTHIHQEYPRDILRKQGNTEIESRLKNQTRVKFGLSLSLFWLESPYTKNHFQYGIKMRHSFEFSRIIDVFDRILLNVILCIFAKNWKAEWEHYANEDE